MSILTTSPSLTIESSFSKYLNGINKIPSLSKEEEIFLAKSYLENQDLDAAHKLVTSHLKLVAKIAMQYKNYGLPVSELVSEGNIGLMQAVKKYDPNLGFRLSTYAMWWIKAAIQEYVLKSWSLVKIGTTSAQKKLFFSLNKIKSKISRLYSRAVTEDDNSLIAQEAGVSEKEVQEMNQRLAGPDISLHKTIGHDDESSNEMIDLIPENKPSHELVFANNQALNNKKKMLGKAMNSLNEREMNILQARKLDSSPSTLDILSNKYKISKERVRQIETRAFEKIQNYILQRISKDGQLLSLNN